MISFLLAPDGRNRGFFQEQSQIQEHVPAANQRPAFRRSTFPCVRVNRRLGLSLSSAEAAHTGGREEGTRTHTQPQPSTSTVLCTVTRAEMCLSNHAHGPSRRSEQQRMEAKAAMAEDACEETAEGCCCNKSTASVASTASASTAASVASPVITPLSDSLESVDLAKVSCDADGQLVLVEHLECDMCPFCDDVCLLPDCITCEEKRCRLGDREKSTWTRCEVRRHCTLASAWLVVGKDVIDSTPFLLKHPAGVKSILRKAGGVDCTEDFEFHSNGARKMWKSYRIGTLVPCASEKSTSDRGRSDCTIM